MNNNRYLNLAMKVANESYEDEELQEGGSPNRHMSIQRKSDSDEDAEINVEVSNTIAKLPDSLSRPIKSNDEGERATRAARYHGRDKTVSGLNRKKKEGVDLHKALYKHEDENKRSSEIKIGASAKRATEVAFTQETRDEKKYKRIKVLQNVGFVAYIAVVIALCYLLQNNWVLLALFFVANYLIVNVGGIYAIRALVFPFSVWLIRDGVEGQNIVRYQTDFANLLDKSYIILKLLTMSDTTSSAQTAAAS